MKLCLIHYHHQYDDYEDYDNDCYLDVAVVVVVVPIQL
jgi:hypothetical protein